MVQITKSEVNIKEKIEQLDYSTVPYDKMPVGSVIQTQYSVLPYGGAVNEAETNSSNFQPTNFIVKISPRFLNSKIIITAAPNIKSNGSSGYHSLAIYKRVGYPIAEYEPVISNSNSTITHGITNHKYDSLTRWYGQANILAIDTPGTVQEVIYQIYHRNSSSGSYYVRTGENSADEWMIATEIKQ